MNSRDHEHRTASRTGGPGTVVRRFTWDEDRPVSEVVAQSIADATDRDTAHLAPLHETIDPDALDTIFAPTSGGTARGDGSVELEHEGCHVLVHHEGRVDVRALWHCDTR